MLNQKKYLLFDLDGVLTDTRSIHFQAFKESLEECGITITEEEHRKSFDGLPTKEKLRKLKNTYNLSDEDEKKIDVIKQTKTISLLNSMLTADDDLINLLRKLSLNYKMCVCSNARRETLDLTLKALGIDKFFDFTLSQQDVEAPKPSPSIYLFAKKRFAATNEECLIIEDSPHGIRAAKESGIEYVVVQDADSLKKTLASWV